MTSPKVTVLMPVYNGERFLREAVDSVLCQTFEDFELLVIDDASTDSTPEILAGYSDPRIRVLRNEQNLKLVRTLNRGLAEARGEYVARLDADDITAPTRAAKQVDVLDTRADVLLVATLYEAIDAHGEVIRTQSDWNATPEEIHYRLVFQNCIGHSTVMFRKERIVEMGGYDVNLKGAEDWGLWSRASRVGVVLFVPEVLCQWRDLGAGLLRSDPEVEILNENDVFRTNVRAISPGLDSELLLCFHNNLFCEREQLTVTTESLLELQRLHALLLRGCPTYLNEDALRQVCSDDLTRWVRHVYRHAGPSQAVRAALTPSLWRPARRMVAQALRRRFGV